MNTDQHGCGGNVGLGSILKLCHAHRYFPVRIGGQDVTSGSRIGGMPPEGVVPPVVTPFTHYLATLSLDNEAELEVSLFTSISCDAEDCFCVEDNVCNVLKAENSPLVQFVVHPFLPRSRESHLGSEFSSQSLVIGPESPESSGSPYLGHKIGGTPFYQRARPYVLENTSKLRAEGYLHLLQFSYPGPDDAGQGEWQLVDFWFSVFAKVEEDRFKFRYVFT